MWRVVLAGIATLGEIRQNWNIVDLFDANMLLDLREEAERNGRDAS